MSRIIVLLLVVLFAATGRAEIAIKEVSWGFRQTPKIAIRPGAFVPAEQWVQAPTRKLPAIPRIALTLENSGRTVEGLVLRYTVSAKVANIKDPSQQGDWNLPFWISEHRVPFLKSKQTLQVPIDDLRLMTSLGDMFKAGFWPTELKIEITIKPRLGDRLPYGVTEKILPVVWKAP